MFLEFINTQLVFTIVLTIGLVLLAIEVFVPSFGIIGILGAFLIFESIFAIQRIENPVMYILISIAISALITLILAKLVFSNSARNRLVLNDNLSNARGSSLSSNRKDLINRIGIVDKVLRPSGTIIIDEKIYNAVSNGNFVKRGSKVIVEKVGNSQLYVKEIL